MCVYMHAMYECPQTLVWPQKSRVSVNTALKTQAQARVNHLESDVKLLAAT